MSDIDDELYEDEGDDSQSSGIDPNELAIQEQLQREQQEDRNRVEQAQQLAKRAMKIGRTTAQAGEAVAGAGGATAGAGAVAGAGAATAGAGGAAAAAGGGAAATAPIWGTILIGILIGIVILVVIFATFYVICNPDSWWGKAVLWIGKQTILPAEVCQYFDGNSTIGGAINSATSAMCSAPSDLAAQNNVPYPAQADPDLANLISCIRGKVNLAGVSIFTYDQSHLICNYTRGQPICEACSHGSPSCHYGGNTGRTGALATDIATTGTTGARVLQAAVTCGVPLKRSTCEDGGSNAVPCQAPGATHVHISIAKCELDNGPINTQ